MISNRFLVLFFFLLSTLGAQVKYSYSYVPKQVYATQVFPITILDDTNSSSTSLKFSFDGGSAEPLATEPIRDINGPNTFYTFYFKAFDTDFKTPNITIETEDIPSKLNGKYIPVAELDTSEQIDFCGLIASDMKILTSQVSTFDGKNNMVSLTIKATEANPREIFVKNAIEYGIEKIKQNGSVSTVDYYFVLPSSIKSTNISYYNSVQHRFVSKTIVTDFKLNPVAAQENLNPIDSSFNKIKKYGMILLTLILLLLYLWRYDIFYLILLILSIFIVIYVFWPMRSICIQEGAVLYILPSDTSTTGGIINTQYQTNEIGHRGIYSKIEYKNGIIGWIRDEDLCKN